MNVKKKLRWWKS